jgi:hypothetical protein
MEWRPTAWDACLTTQSLPRGHAEAPRVGRRRYKQPKALLSKQHTRSDRSWEDEVPEGNGVEAHRLGRMPDHTERFEGPRGSSSAVLQTADEKGREEKVGILRTALDLKLVA